LPEWLKVAEQGFDELSVLWVQVGALWKLRSRKKTIPRDGFLREPYA
jgi:hypothetical protein